MAKISGVELPGHVLIIYSFFGTGENLQKTAISKILGKSEQLKIITEPSITVHGLWTWFLDLSYYHHQVIFHNNDVSLHWWPSFWPNFRFLLPLSVCQIANYLMHYFPFYAILFRLFDYLFSAYTKLSEILPFVTWK